jgi:hypothetical protein
VASINPPPENQATDRRSTIPAAAITNDESMSLAENQTRAAVALMSIPVRWSTDSGGCGPASESLTQVKNMMIEVDHFSQEKSIGMAGSHHFVFSYFVP